MATRNEPSTCQPSREVSFSATSAAATGAGTAATSDCSGGDGLKEEEETGSRQITPPTPRRPAAGNPCWRIAGAASEGLVLGKEEEFEQEEEDKNVSREL